jgi:hypothetical protein
MQESLKRNVNSVVLHYERSIYQKWGLHHGEEKQTTEILYATQIPLYLYIIYALKIVFGCVILLTSSFYCAELLSQLRPYGAMCGSVAT